MRKPMGLLQFQHIISSYLSSPQLSKGPAHGWRNIDESLIRYVQVEGGRIRKMIKCANCEYTTTAPSHYLRHEVKHSKAKPHCCPICPAKFQRRYKVKGHLLKHHANENQQLLSIDYLGIDVKQTDTSF
ncbi:zinc finger protein-like [Tropilaelaps mercedesae]|uniref:Zinc finger protein-like n=1 Tax=Tropilaelaps mercedesae TaxID=418985 RepID=A0A1V9XK95_9ACAR|nr:zinc finger protein-like [Tropilaelaps mercedesae]